jgi:hypothetical protein
VRVAIVILALLAVVIVVVASGAGTGVDGKPAAVRPGGGLDPDVALRVRSSRPAEIVEQLARREAGASIPPEILRALRRETAAIRRSGVDLEGDLLARLSFVVVSVERRCPPPALLACRPAIRILGRLRERPSPDLERKLRRAVVAALGAAGFSGMSAESSGRGDRIRGRVSAGAETLARWRASDGRFQLATGGLDFKRGDRLPDEASYSRLKIEINRRALEKLVGPGGA